MKIKKILVYGVMMLAAISCSTSGGKMAKYNDMEATIVTNKGDINIFLYPNAAPKTVANFVFLANKDFYDGLTFHRIEPVLVQGGDPVGNGTGGTGYVIPDEFNSFLKFNYPGIIAMANAGSNTSSSQFFITKAALPMLNDNYSAFGSLRNSDDMIVVKSLEKGDFIEDVIIKGNNANTYLDNFKPEVRSWTEAMKKKEKLALEDEKSKIEEKIKLEKLEKDKLEAIKKEEEKLAEVKEEIKPVIEKKVEEVKEEIKVQLPNNCTESKCILTGFNISGNKLTQNEIMEIKKIAQLINSSSIEKNVVVSGYTDSTGSSEYNQKLSVKRANHVATALKENGLNSDINVIVKGMGESNPIATNNTKEGRFQNRRVEILYNKVK